MRPLLLCFGAWFWIPCSKKAKYEYCRKRGVIFFWPVLSEMGSKSVYLTPFKGRLTAFNLFESLKVGNLLSILLLLN